MSNPKYNVKRAVVTPLAKIEIGVPFAFTATTEIETKQVQNKRGVMEDQHSILVSSVETGEVQKLLMNTVLYGILKDEGSIKGRSYEVTKGEKVKGKEYFPFTVNEIELA